MAALFHGGGQEQSMRAGTLATQQIVGLAEALQIAYDERETFNKKMHDLRKQFLSGLKSVNFKINGLLAESYPGILNLQFPTVNVQTLMKDLPQLAFSAGSACLTQRKGESSHVLRALGCHQSEALSSLRFSFGRFTTETEIDCATRALCYYLSQL